MVMELTAEQRETVHELQRELDAIDLKADIEWAKYIHTKDEDCFTEVLALESEREMMGLVAYIPKAGERRIGKIRALVGKLKDRTTAPRLGINEVRLSTLDSVNEWRASYKLPPLERLPQGIPGDSHECTLARAFRTSLIEMGVTEASVTVNGSADIGVSGYLNGETWGDNPDLGNDANTLIGQFDEHAWLDLLTDSALEHYADDRWEEDDEERLEEISAEFKRRGLTYTVGYKRRSGDYYEHGTSRTLGEG
jgi:hypothetical protein